MTVAPWHTSYDGMIKTRDAASAQFPPTLLKASVDNGWYYAAKLVSGEVVSFCGAQLFADGWVRLHRSDYPLADYNDDTLPVAATRGLDVRVSDIVWVADGDS